MTFSPIWRNEANQFWSILLMALSPMGTMIHAPIGRRRDSRNMVTRLNSWIWFFCGITMIVSPMVGSLLIVICTWFLMQVFVYLSSTIFVEQCIIVFLRSKILPNYLKLNSRTQGSCYQSICNLLAKGSQTFLWIITNRFRRSGNVCQTIKNCLLNDHKPFTNSS